MSKWLLSSFLFVSALVFAPIQTSAQVVAVTLRLDTNIVSVGGGTTLRVFAQVIPSVRTNADRIFSWYVDVLNTNGPVATANYASMQKSASDNLSQISSNGFNDGVNRRGIYDTFMNLPGAGVSNAVELMAIPVTGSSAGQTRFQVRAGSGVPALSSDFLVAPIGGGAPLTGGDYSAANVNLTVVSVAACPVTLQIAPLTGGGGPGQSLQLSFTPCPGFNHTIEYRDALQDAAGWRPLAGAPHNSGSATVINTNSQRFYRVSTTSGP